MAGGSDGVVLAHNILVGSSWSRGINKPCKADTEHVFEGGDLVAEGEDTRVFSHVELTLVPDGGAKRFRIFGRRAWVLHVHIL